VTYDASGSVATTSDPNGNVTHYGHDLENRQTQMTDALGDISTVIYLCSCQHPGAGFFGLVCWRGSQGTGRFSFAHRSMAA
jgi:YD repeat-containing protein